MRRIIITFLFVALLVVSSRSARGFALLGPRSDFPGLPATDSDTPWQTTTIGYDLTTDNGTPKNVGQGYRWNIPVLYYADDPSFSDYFGLQGEEAVDSAFAILNSTFTNNSLLSLDGYSSNLVEFPFNSQSYNYTAESLGLTDLKSETLALMMEELGLAQPERYTWTLHDRELLPSDGTCPLDEVYLVVQRNYYYVPTSLFEDLYSPYVNDTLYTYAIDEYCSPPEPPDAVTDPEAVDPVAGGPNAAYTAVAGLGAGLGEENMTGSGGLWTSTESGGFYTGLTRDDVGGLRYLMSSNNVVYENPGLGSLLEATNFNPQPLTTSPLGPLLQFAQTNSSAALLAAYPNLVIDSVSNYYTLVTNWTVYSYYTNYYGEYYPTPPTLIVGTNGYTLSWQTNYVYTFGNMVIVDYYSNTPAQLVTTSLGPPSDGSPYGTPYATNVVSQNIVLTNVPSGDYYLLPPGSCGYDIVVTKARNQFTGTITNIIAAATNSATTNSAGFVGTESIVTYLTNNLFEYYACNLQTSSPAYYQGIGHIQFVRVPDAYIDPLTGAFLNSSYWITNTYTMVVYTNNQFITQTFQRVVTQPDISFEGADIASPNPGSPVGIGVTVAVRSIPNWDIANIIPNLAGPGTINPPVAITFDEVGDIYGNGSLAENNLGTNGFLSQVDQGGLLAYGSFDGTTNQPVVYPNDTSIQELENGLIIAVAPMTLPNGTNGVAYPTIQFTATGGQGPDYTWSLDGTQLPEGLAFYNGVLSGTPVNNASGPYDFTIEVTDESNRSVLVSYTITIN